MLVDLTSISISQITIKNGGGIIFKDQDSTFKSKNFTIEYGYLAIGWEDLPFKSKLNMVFDSPCSAESSSTCPPYGLTMKSGFMSIQGVPRLRYMTELAYSAWAGQTIVMLANKVDWVAGEEVIVSSTTLQLYSIYTSEALTIADATNVSTSTALNFNTAPQYSHLTDSSTCNTRTLTIVPKVALLSRNILISGTYSSFAQNSGPSLRLQGFNRNGRENIVFKISSVAFQYCGTTGTFGSCILIDSIVSRGASYFKNSVIRESVNRGITLASVQNLILPSNTIFNVFGHGIALVNGDEFQNKIDSNFICKIQTSQRITSSDFLPAGILLANPSNMITNNRIVDVLNYGISFQIPSYPTGNFQTVTFCPQGMPLLKFDNNIINSVGSDGIYIWNYNPRSLPCELPWTPGNYPLPNMKISNTIVWMANGYGVRSATIGAINFTNLYVDYVAASGFFLAAMVWHRDVTVGVYDSTFQGHSACAVCDPNAGFVQPSWDGYQLVNASFCEWEENIPAIYMYDNSSTGAKTLFSSELYFDNVIQHLTFGHALSSVLADTDGSLYDSISGTSSGGNPHYFAYSNNYTVNASGCPSLSNPANSVDCNEQSKPLRVVIQSLSNYTLSSITIGRIADWVNDNQTSQPYTNTTALRYNKYDIQDPINTDLATATLPIGYVYTVSLPILNGSSGLYIKGSEFVQANEPPITLRFNLTLGFRPTFEVVYMKNSTFGDLLQEKMWNPQDPLVEDGSYYFDETENHLYLAISGNNKKEASEIQILSLYDCDETCKTCDGPTENSCLTCYSGYLLNVDSSCTNASDGISFFLADTSLSGVYMLEFSIPNQNLVTDMWQYLSWEINQTQILNNSDYVMKVLYNGTIRFQLVMNTSVPADSLLRAEFSVTQTSNWTLINSDATITMKGYAPVTPITPGNSTPSAIQTPSLGKFVGDIASAANFAAVIPLMAQSLLRVGDNTIARMSNLMDLVNYLRFLNINYPKMVEDLFNASSGVNMDINFYVNIFGGIAYEYPEDELKGPIYSKNPKFEAYEVQPSFTYNFGEKLTTGLIMFLIVAILSQLLHYQKKLNKAVIKIASFALEYVKGNVLLMAYLSYQIDLSVATFFQTFYLKSSFGEVVNEIFSFVGLILGFILPVYAFYMCLKIREYMKTHSNIDRAEERFQWAMIAFRELKDDKLPQLMMLPLFITRSVLFSLIVVYLYNYPLVQGVLNFMISLCYTSYIWYYRPLAEEKDLYPEVFQQSIYLVLSTCVMMLGIDDKYGGWAPDSNVKSTLRVVVGWVIVTMCFMMVLTYYYMSLLSAWKVFQEVYMKIWAYRERRREHKKRLERREVSTAAQAKELMLIDNMDEMKDSTTSPRHKVDFSGLHSESNPEFSLKSSETRLTGSTMSPAKTLTLTADNDPPLVSRSLSNTPLNPRSSTLNSSKFKIRRKLMVHTLTLQTPDSKDAQITPSDVQDNRMSLNFPRQDSASSLHQNEDLKSINLLTPTNISFGRQNADVFEEALSGRQSNNNDFLQIPGQSRRSQNSMGSIPNLESTPKASFRAFASENDPDNLLSVDTRRPESKEGAQNGETRVPSDHDIERSASHNPDSIRKMFLDPLQIRANSLTPRGISKFKLRKNTTRFTLEFHDFNNNAPPIRRLGRHLPITNNLVDSEPRILDSHRDDALNTEMPLRIVSDELIISETASGDKKPSDGQEDRLSTLSKKKPSDPSYTELPKIKFSLVPTSARTEDMFSSSRGTERPLINIHSERENMHSERETNRSAFDKEDGKSDAPIDIPADS